MGAQPRRRVDDMCEASCYEALASLARTWERIETGNGKVKRRRVGDSSLPGEDLWCRMPDSAATLDLAKAVKELPLDDSEGHFVHAALCA